MTKKKKNTKLTIRQKNARKRYRNAKGHFVSYEEVQDIKNYWKRGIRRAKNNPNGRRDAVAANATNTRTTTTKELVTPKFLRGPATVTRWPRNHKVTPMVAELPTGRRE